MKPNELPYWVLPALAAAVLAIFAGAVIESCFVTDTTLRTTMFTGAMNLAAGVAGYYFGSSNSSAKKDSTIAAAATGTGTGATP
jgi:hypothetical protein